MICMGCAICQDRPYAVSFISSRHYYKKLLKQVVPRPPADDNDPTLDKSDIPYLWCNFSLLITILITFLKTLVGIF